MPDKEFKITIRTQRDARMFVNLMVGVPMAIMLGAAYFFDWGVVAAILGSAIAGMMGGVMMLVLVIRGSREK